MRNGPRRTRFAQSLAFLHSSQSFLVLFNWIPNLLPLGHAQDGGHGQVEPARHALGRRPIQATT